MSIDYNAILYDPVYNALGVPAMLTHTAGVSEITVIDDTRAKSVTTGSLETRSVGPGAFARVPELTAQGVDRSDYDGSMLAFNGRIWIVRSHELRGSPNGEDLGEVRFLLKASND
jgi:hypothetical protein